MSAASGRLILAFDHYALQFTKKRKCESQQELVGSTTLVTGMDPINMGWYWFETGKKEIQFTR